MEISLEAERTASNKPLRPKIHAKSVNSAVTVWNSAISFCTGMLRDDRFALGLICALLLRRSAYKK